MEITKSLFQTTYQNVPPTRQAKESVYFSEILAGYQSANIIGAETKTVSAEAVFAMNTSQGEQNINLDDYLTPGPQPPGVNLDDVALLLPSAHNIDTLAKYSQEKFKGLLEEYDIPLPPATIEFDSHGQLVLPADYPYSAQLKQAFTENPTVENALRTTAALASHYAGIMEAQPFRDEMSTARSQADRDRIIEKYSYLFDDNRPGKQIVLTFLEDGSMLLGEKKNAQL